MSMMKSARITKVEYTLQHQKKRLRVVRLLYLARNMVAKFVSYILDLPWNYAAAHMQITLAILVYSKLLPRQVWLLAFDALKLSQAMQRCVILINVKWNLSKKSVKSK